MHYYIHMAKTATKNHNLWSDSRIEMEYQKAYAELKDIVAIGREIKSGNYQGPFKGYLHIPTLKTALINAQYDVIKMERLINERNEFNKNTNLKLKDWNRNLRFKQPEIKSKTAEEIKSDNDFLDEINDLLKD